MQTTQQTPIALTIAGSDSSGGAGIQADIKTFSALGVYGTSAITAITAQNTQGVSAIEAITPTTVAQQISCVLDDLAVSAIKTGMLHNAAVIEAVCSSLKEIQIPVIVDPVMVATSGDRLLDEDAEQCVKKMLLPLATLITPNLQESARLLNCAVANSVGEMEQQAKRLLMLGCNAVLLKGGHLNERQSADIFVSHTETRRFDYEKIDTENTHGTGCTLASAITAGLAKGLALPKAIAEAKHYLHSAILYADKLAIGKGPGPVNHFYKFW